MKNRTWIWIVVILALFLALFSAICVGCGLLVQRAPRDDTRAIGVGDAVGVIYVEGEISNTADGIAPIQTNVASAPAIIEFLQQAESAPAVKAILLHINTPGGGVVASDEIHYQLTRMQKPVVVWMGDMAASGGYYIAAAADHIVAHPDTLTGSIGVITQILNVEELMKKVGVEMSVIKSSGLKDIGSMYREMTDDEKALWQGIINETYEHFVQVVAEGRKMDPARVRELADGRIYTGRQALELGLVDEVGNLSDAVRVAAEMGGIQGEPRLLEYQRSVSLFDWLVGFASLRGGTADLLHLMEDHQVPSLRYQHIGP